MKCPHCLVVFHEGQTFWSVGLGSDFEGAWVLSRVHCPACNRFAMYLENGSTVPNQAFGQGVVGARVRPKKRVMVLPKASSRSPIGPEIPAAIAEDYMEACIVLADSPKASAALSRRCLQNLLRNAAGVTPSNLSNEIQQVLDSGKLPTHIADNIDCIRNVGNFAAHPNKSESSGEVLPVEPHEAEWNLDVLESLFDFYFVQPVHAKAKREALNQKLADAGKPPLK